MGEEYLTATTAAAELEKQLGWLVSPRHVTMLFYLRDISSDRAPIVGGRRLIARDLLPIIANALRRRGWYKPGRVVLA